MEPSPVLGKSPRGTNTSSIICWKGLSLNGTPLSSIFSVGGFSPPPNGVSNSDDIQYD